MGEKAAVLTDGERQLLTSRLGKRMFEVITSEKAFSERDWSVTEAVHLVHFRWGSDLCRVGGRYCVLLCSAEKRRYFR